MTTPTLRIEGVELAGLRPTYDPAEQTVNLSNTDGVLVAQIPQFGRDFDEESEEAGPAQSAVASKIAEVLNTRAAEEAPQPDKGPGWFLIQEGGSSTELYLHGWETEAEAEADRFACRDDGGYRTSAPIQGPAALARLTDSERGEIYDWVEQLLRMSQEVDFPDGEPPADEDDEDEAIDDRAA